MCLTSVFCENVFRVFNCPNCQPLCKTASTKKKKSTAPTKSKSTKGKESKPTKEKEKKSTKGKESKPTNVTEVENEEEPGMLKKF